MKYLLTGSKGFIGSHLKEKLLKQGHEVISLAHQALRDIEYLQDHPVGHVDYIIHCAAYGNMSSHQDDREMIRANINNLYNLLDHTKYTEYKGFINVSSSSTLLDYTTMYSATKKAGEEIVNAFVNTYEKPVISVLPFTVIGKGEQENHLIPKLIDSCLNGTGMQFVGEPVHDYIGVDDFCEAVLFMLDNKIWLNLVSGLSIEVGTGTKTTNEEVLKIVENVTGKKANIERVDSLRGYDCEEWVSTDEVLKIIGWRAKQRLEDIIREMV